MSTTFIVTLNQAYIILALIVNVQYTIKELPIYQIRKIELRHRAYQYRLKVNIYVIPSIYVK